MNICDILEAQRGSNKLTGIIAADHNEPIQKFSVAAKRIKTRISEKRVKLEKKIIYNL